ncbi:hypothetical protein RchiOBHm_Chr2g0174051 [Rosa chinensis]|uniref:Uncharacterized protein n=1 Tax=Rosa chinensis TaxID=74649 RepID=A0A2P6S621_ROSCH|nr:hypothetical protein RchiOBHm_Chr2g0174051 [Rosa chinensis]
MELWVSVYNHLINFSFRYLVECNNILPDQLHTKHPELCDRFGGLLAMHIDDVCSSIGTYVAFENRRSWSSTLRHKMMIYPGYIPQEGVVPILLHYGLPFSVGNWSFSKFDHRQDGIVYDCGRRFPELAFLSKRGMCSESNRQISILFSIGNSL